MIEKLNNESMKNCNSGILSLYDEKNNFIKNFNNHHEIIEYLKDHGDEVPKGTIYSLYDRNLILLFCGALGFAKFLEDSYVSKEKFTKISKEGSSQTVWSTNNGGLIFSRS